MELLKIMCGYNEVLLKQDENGLYIESWGASTKHPDRVEYFSKYDKSEFMSTKENVYLWILKCATECAWYRHATMYLELAEAYRTKNVFHF